MSSQAGSAPEFWVTLSTMIAARLIASIISDDSISADAVDGVRLLAIGQLQDSEDARCSHLTVAAEVYEQQAATLQPLNSKLPPAAARLGDAAISPAEMRSRRYGDWDVIRPDNLHGNACLLHKWQVEGCSRSNPGLARWPCAYTLGRHRTQRLYLFSKVVSRL